MATQVTNLENPQQLEAAVNGPDGATRLIVCTGIAPIAQEADAGTVTQTWTWRVGPVLVGGQFRGAVAQGALVRFSQTGAGGSWSLIGIDADWDDESGQVEVRAKIQIIAPGLGISARVQGISYQVTILGAGASEPLSKAPEPARPIEAAPPSPAPPAHLPGTAGAGRASLQEAPPPPTTPDQPAPPSTPPQQPAPPPPPPAEVKPAAQMPETMILDRPARPPAPAPPSKPAPGPGAPQAGPPSLVLKPQLLEFGEVPVGGFRVKTVAITNTGSRDSGPLEMALAGADAGEFTLTPDAMANTNVPPGASGHVLVSFQPTSPGAKAATIKVRTATGGKLEGAIVGSGN